MLQIDLTLFVRSNLITMHLVPGPGKAEIGHALSLEPIVIALAMAASVALVDSSVCRRPDCCPVDYEECIETRSITDRAQTSGAVKPNVTQQHSRGVSDSLK